MSKFSLKTGKRYVGPSNVILGKASLYCFIASSIPFAIGSFVNEIGKQ